MGADGSQLGSPRSTNMLSDIAQVRQLVQLSRTRCEIKSTQVAAILGENLGGQLFKWDASAVGDGTFHGVLSMRQ